MTKRYKFYELNPNKQVNFMLDGDFQLTGFLMVVVRELLLKTFLDTQNLLTILC
jgi:hypothetical protein